MGTGQAGCSMSASELFIEIWNFEGTDKINVRGKRGIYMRWSANLHWKIGKKHKNYRKQNNYRKQRRGVSFPNWGGGLYTLGWGCKNISSLRSCRLHMLDVQSILCTIFSIDTCTKTLHKRASTNTFLNRSRRPSPTHRQTYRWSS